MISSASDRDAAEATNIAFDIFLEVAIVNAMRKSHERSSVGISRVPSKWHNSLRFIEVSLARVNRRPRYWHSYEVPLHQLWWSLLGVKTKLLWTPVTRETRPTDRRAASKLHESHQPVSDKRLSPDNMDFGDATKIKNLVPLFKFA